MSFVDWSSQYSVHDSKMDEQHQHLFSLVNALHEAIFNKTHKVVVKQTVHALLEYTQRHFADEEKLMQHYGYPKHSQHKAEHDALLGAVQAFGAKLGAGDVSTAADMLQFLVSDWLVRHILSADKDYGFFIQKCRLAGVPVRQVRTAW